MLYPKTILSLIAVIFLSGCTQQVFNKAELMDIQHENRVDLLDMFAKNYQASMSLEKQHEHNQKFYEKYFRPWKIEKLPYSKEDASWGINAYGKSKSLYGENRRGLSSSYLMALVDNTNFDDYNSLNQRAITLKNTSLRVLPTDKPLFWSFDKAGEGYPFDNNQKSLLFINHPLLISHLSKDRAWAFVESPFANGWVKMNDIAYVDSTFVESFQQKEFVTILKDNTPIYKHNSHFLEYAKVGSSFPIVNESPGYYLVYVATKDVDANAMLTVIQLDKNIVAKKPIQLNLENVVKLSKEFLGEKYGWGGSFMNRDCSAMIRDFFAPFGLWLPRNSKVQAQHAKYIDLSKMSKEEKEQYIIKHAQPFETMIYMKGHIMLYIGHVDNRVYALHNMWGIRTKDATGKIAGRKIVGQTVVTSLHLGEGLEGVEESALYINKVLGITLVGREK